MSVAPVLPRGYFLNLRTPSLRCGSPTPITHFCCFNVRRRLSANENVVVAHVSQLFGSRIRCFKQEGAENFEAVKPKNIPEPDSQDSFVNEVQIKGKGGHNKTEISFLAMIAIALGIAVIATLASIGNKPILGSTFRPQILAEGSSSSAVAPAPGGFAFKFFGYSVILPEYAPGWVYFWLLMAAGCGLFISEEALNIWVCAFHWLVYQ